MVEKYVTNVGRSIKMENDSYKDLSDGEVLDLIFDKFGIQDNDHATEQLMSKIDKLLEYKNADDN